LRAWATLARAAPAQLARAAGCLPDPVVAFRQVQAEACPLDLAAAVQSVQAEDCLLAREAAFRPVRVGECLRVPEGAPLLAPGVVFQPAPVAASQTALAFGGGVTSTATHPP
jgi:hypothetical protein